MDGRHPRGGNRARGQNPAYRLTHPLYTPPATDLRTRCADPVTSARIPPGPRAALLASATTGSCGAEEDAMSGRTWLAASGLVAVAVTVGLTGCTSPGNLSVENNGPTDVTVVVGDERATASAGGGVVLLDYGCSPGDVTVEFPASHTVVVPGPVCPDQRIVIGDGEVVLRATATDDS